MCYDAMYNSTQISKITLHSFLEVCDIMHAKIVLDMGVY